MLISSVVLQIALGSDDFQVFTSLPEALHVEDFPKLDTLFSTSHPSPEALEVVCMFKDSATAVLLVTLLLLFSYMQQ